MENMVISELEKQKQILKNGFKERFNLSESELDKISDEISSIIMNLISLMKEGKSAHEKFFSDIIVNSIDAIVGFDNDYKIFLWNKGAEDIFGYKKEEITGMDFSVLIPDYLIEKGEKEYLINEVKEHGFLANYETDRKTKSGEIKKVSITRFEIKDEKNIPIGSVGIIRDITLVKKLEMELRERENLALIGEVVSSIAHSLSNPLNIISGNADFLLFNKKEGDPEYEELKTIIDETTRITKSIRHLLNFSRPVKTDKKPNDVNELLKKIIGEIKFQTGNKIIRVRHDLQQELPLISFDKEQFEECLRNIVTNAIQSIQTKGEIKIKTYSEKDKLFIEISDKGQGIPPESLSKIFLPFFSSKEYGKGTGLGLAIAQKIIKEHEGNINVKSQVGKGTKFIISLPIKLN